MKYIPVLLLSLLLFVLSVPGTNALRYLLASILLIFAVVTCCQKRYFLQEVLSHRHTKRVFLGLALLTIYILLHSIFISHEIAWSLKEFKGHWLVPMVFFILGTLLAKISQCKKYYNPELLITALFFGMFLHILYVDFVALAKYLSHGFLLSRYGGMTGSPVLANYLTNILFGLIVAEWISRTKRQEKIILVPNFILFVIFLALIMSTIVEGMRHGVIALAFVSVASLFFYLYQNDKHSRKQKIAIGLVVLLVLLAPLSYSLKFDARWKTLLETVPIAFDTETYRFWQDRANEKPKLSDGTLVSSSNYERIAWFKKGVEYIVKDPVGIGLGRNAFGHAIQMYEGVDSARGYHSHSSIIDFTIGVGLVGVIAWIAIICYLLYFFLKSFKSDPNFYAVSGFLLTSGFFFRSVVDSNMRDHMFQQFFLILGIILVLLFYRQLKGKQ